MFRVRKTSLLALVALFLAMGALYLFRDRPLQGITPTARPAPPIELEAPYRGPVTLDDFRGDVVTITFGRPSCDASCNPALETLRAAMSALGGRRSRVRVLYVDLEPGRTNEQELLAFVQDHDLGFTGLYGDPGAVARAERAYRTVLEEVPDSVRARGDLRDTQPIFGIDSDGVLRVVWTTDDPAVVAGDLRTLLRY